MSSEQPQQSIPHAYFLISGEVEYVEPAQDQEQQPTFKYRKVDMIFSTPEFRIVGKDLAKIQTNLQLAFHRKHSRTAGEAPQVTSVVILAVSLLGQMLPEGFRAGVPNEG